MTESSKLSKRSSSLVMLRGSAKRSRVRQDLQFVPQSLSFALAQAFGAASVRVSQAITGLSLTFAGLGQLHAQNLPQGGVAVHGGANIQQNGNTLNVNTTNGAGNTSVINWQSFNIGSGHATNINQPNVGSSSINRVVTNIPSQIHGTLRSNGNVILVNQNGIAVGAGGVVDTAGFTASTLGMSEADARAGRLRFEGNALSGGVQVDGVIRSRNGDVVLIAPQIATGKDALIKAENGNVILGAGQTVEVVGRGLEGMRFIVQGADNKVINLGTLQGNAVGVFAGTLRHSGVIQAQTATMEGGKVVLRAIKDIEIVKDASSSKAPIIEANGGTNAGQAQAGGSISIQSTQGNITVGAGASISANAGNSVPISPVAGIGAAGGAIEIVANQGRVLTEAGSSISATGQPGGTIRIFGGQESRIASLINASSPSVGAADATGTLQLISASHVGGTIQILSPGTVSLDTGAQLLASGDSGGGTILVGGDYKGANADITNAYNTNISSGVLLEANARVNGKGGKAIVWADNDTYFAGTLHAKGGEQGGDGGFGETSGKKNLYFRGRADLTARRGRTGTLLLDPDEILIQGGSGTSDPAFTGGTITAAAGGTLATIYESTLESIGLTANILLEAANKITFGLTPFTDNGLVVAQDLTLRTTNASVVPSMGVVFAGWNAATMPQFTIQAGGNILLEAGTQWTGGINGPNVVTTNFSNTGEKVSIISTGGSITMKAATGIGLGNGSVLIANKNISISTGEFGNSAVGGDINISSFGAVQGVQMNAESISIHARGPDKLLQVVDNAQITATGTGDSVSLVADRFQIQSTSTVVASTGSILIRPNDNNRLIKIGGNTDSSGSGSLQISQNEFNVLSANKAIRFGDTTSFAGNILLAVDQSILFGVNNVALLSSAASSNITQNIANSITGGNLRMEAGSINLGGSSNTINQIAAKSTAGSIDILTGNTNTFIAEIDGLAGINSAGTLSISNTNIAPSNLYLDKGGITTNGNINIVNFETLSVYTGAFTIDSSSANVGNSGSINLGTAVIQGNSPGVLSLDTFTTEIFGLGLAGNITFGNVVTNTLGQSLGGLIVNSSAPSAANFGQINLPASIAVSGGNVSLNGRVTLTQDAAITTFSNGQVILQGEVQGNNDLTINANGQVALQGEIGTGTALNDISITSANVISLSNRIKADGNLSLVANGGGNLNMTAAAEIDMIGTGSPGSRLIQLFGQGGVQLGKIAGTSAYKATVEVGAAGAGITTAAAVLTNLSGMNEVTLGSAAASANVASAAAPVRLSNIAGSLSASIQTQLHVENDAAAPLFLDAIDVNNGSSDAVVDIFSQNKLSMSGPNEFNINGIGKAEVSLRTSKEFVNSTAINAGSSSGSILTIAADERIYLDSDSAISDFAGVVLRGQTAGRNIAFVDSDTTGSAGGALDIGYGSLNRIFGSVGLVTVGASDLSGGNILFDGTQNFSPPFGAKNYSFFSGGSISSKVLRAAQLDQAGFKATGNIDLTNFQLQGSNPIVAADSTTGYIVINAASTDLTIGQVGPAPTSITGLKTQGVNLGINVTNSGGGVKVSQDIDSAGQASLTALTGEVSIDSTIVVKGIAVAGSASVLLKGTDVTINGSIDANGGNVLLLPSFSGTVDAQIGVGATSGFSLTGSDFSKILNADTIFVGSNSNRFRDVNVVGAVNVGAANLTIIAGDSSTLSTAISQAAGTVITAKQLFADAVDKSIHLAGNNLVDTFSATTTGTSSTINFSNSQNFGVGSIFGVQATGAASSVTLSSAGAITQVGLQSIAAGTGGLFLEAITGLGTSVAPLLVASSTGSPLNLSVELDTLANNTAGAYIDSRSQAALSFVSGVGVNSLNLTSLTGNTLLLGSSINTNDDITIASGLGFQFGTNSITAGSLTLSAQTGGITSLNAGLDIDVNNVKVASTDGINSLNIRADTFDLSVANLAKFSNNISINATAKTLTGGKDVLSTSQFTIDSADLGNFNLLNVTGKTLELNIDTDVGNNKTYNSNFTASTIRLGTSTPLTFQGTGLVSITGSTIQMNTVKVDNTLTLNGNSTLQNLATLSGNGTLSMGGADVLTAASGSTITPGSTPGVIGTLTVNGNLTFDGTTASDRSSLIVDLAANSSDLLIVQNNVQFTGVGPSVKMAELASPSVLQRFQGGEIQTLISAGGTFTASSYSANTSVGSPVFFNAATPGKTLTAKAVGVQNTWTGATDSQWSVGSNWSRGDAPGLYHEVTIGVAPNPVLLTSASQASSVILSDNTLDLNTNALTVAPQRIGAPISKIGAAGILNLNNGEFKYSGLTLTNESGALITGAGDLNTSLLNLGTIAPGTATSTGKITIYGNFTNAPGGVMDISIDSNNIVTPNDALVVFNSSVVNVSNGSVLTLTPINGGTISVGNNFNFIETNGLGSGGSFTVGAVTSTITSPAGLAGTVSFGSTFANVSISSAALANGIWDGSSDGDGDGFNWSDPFNWSNNTLPSATDLVTLSPAGFGSITIGAGVSAGGFNGLFLGADDNLFIATGGSLALPSTNLNLSGTLSLVGGTLNLPSTGGKVASLFTWSGGTVSGLGNWSGANLSGAGARTLAMGSGELSVVGGLPGGSLSLLSGSISNIAGFSVSSGAKLSYDGGQVNTPLLSNSGLIQINTGSALLPIAPFTSGSFEIANGAELSFFNNTTLAAGSSILGGTLSVVSGKTLDATAAGLLNRGVSSVTQIAGTLLTAGLETSELIFTTGGSLSGAAGSTLNVNTKWDDTNAAGITGFTNIAITQAAGDLNIHNDIKAASTISLNANTGKIQSLGPNGISAATVLAFADGNIDLRSASLTSTTVSAESKTGDIQLGMQGELVLGDITTAAGKTASIIATGKVSQGAAITTLGSLELDMNSSDLTLSNVNNQFGQGLTVIDGGQVILQAAAGSTLAVAGNMVGLQAFGDTLQLGNSSLGLTVTDTGASFTAVAQGSISQAGVLNIAGSSDLTAVGGNISLVTASTYGGLVRLISGGSSEINSNGGLTFAQVSAQNFTAKAVGNIAQIGAINVGAGLTSLEAPGQTIQLLNPANDFANLQIVDSATLQIVDANNLTINGKATSTADISFATGINSTSLITPNLSLSATSALANVNMGVNVSGATTFNFVGGGSYNNITVNNASTGTSTYGSIVTGGDVALSQAGAVSVGIVQAGKLDITAAGAVSQYGAINAAEVSVNAAGFDVLLTDGTNAIGQFSVAGKNVSLTSLLDVNPNISATGNVVINADSITQSVSNAIASGSLLANVNGGIDLLGNNQLGAVSGSAATGTINIKDIGGSLVLNNLQAPAGDINITSTGALVQGSGALSAIGINLNAAGLGSSGAGMLLIDAGNSVTFNATGGDAYLRNNNNNKHLLTGASAVGVLHYETTTGSGYEIRGDVSARDVELLSGGLLQIGGGANGVRVTASNSLLLEAMAINLGSAAATASQAVQSNGSLTVNSFGDLNITGGQTGAFSSLDAVGAVSVNVLGGINITGGAGGAYARLDPTGSASMNITAGAGINLLGGTGAGAYAAIVSDGNITINAPSLNLTPGSGLDADAVVLSNFGLISSPSNCNGCLVLSVTPLGNGITNAGIYIPPPPPPPAPAPAVSTVPDANAVPVQLAQIGGALQDAERDPEDVRETEPDISVEGQNCP
ncbi:filamentous hemagglutinin N-terminal domain-containing protein [Variovorax sp. PCZ-1]|uniref:filamentous hemagglutinin N-terminal domain-containing protein n=1 Tax=Variovorax sp. PCZ-1 TaxID=2835533 RepID=UPI001BCC834F|nr:filamentous hemagglutinin N-terminal domain-containing protein [Variovorax sp. PCZ-1]MBS7807823.1 filamentous hemagglutinin N-terminal domain-containing protein [Variovorax sp. PCZ-1]